MYLILSHLRTRNQQYLQYKQRCNAFFMQLVGRLCFEGNQPPEPKVVEGLLNLVIFKPTV